MNTQTNRDLNVLPIDLRNYIYRKLIFSKTGKEMNSNVKLNKNGSRDQRCEFDNHLKLNQNKLWIWKLENCFGHCQFIEIRKN